MLKSVLIADDHPIVQSGVSDLLKNHFGVLEIILVNNGHDVIRIINEVKNLDLVVLDISMPQTNIFNLVKDIRKKDKAVKIIVYSIFSSIIYEHRLINQGIDGYVEKKQPISELKNSIQKLILGKTASKNYDSKKDIQLDTMTHSPLDVLSNKELVVAEFIACGYTNTTIAKKLNLSQSTIGTYKLRIFEKLNILSVIDLAELFTLHSYKE